MGTTNSEAVVSISSIELHVFKSQLYCKKFRPRQQSQKVLWDRTSVWVRKLNLEQKSTNDEHTYISSTVVGCLWGEKDTLPVFFFSPSVWRSQHDKTYSIYLPRERLWSRSEYRILPKSSYMKYICISIDREYIKWLPSSKSLSFSFAHKRGRPLVQV